MGESAAVPLIEVAAPPRGPNGRLPPLASFDPALIRWLRAAVLIGKANGEEKVPANFGAVLSAAALAGALDAGWLASQLGEPWGDELRRKFEAPPNLAELLQKDSSDPLDAISQSVDELLHHAAITARVARSGESIEPIHLV